MSGRYLNRVLADDAVEALFFPQASWVLDAVHERILPLKEYRPQADQSLTELVRRANTGI